MEPGFHKPGNDGTAEMIRGHRGLLQWSRAFISPETAFIAELCPSLEVKLQWSRAFISPETAVGVETSQM